MYLNYDLKEYGMHSTGGMGIDGLVMLLTGQ